MALAEREPTYATVEDVEETLDLPDPHDVNGVYRFNDESHPSYERVKKFLLAAEDEIDRRTNRSWRVNVVKDYMTDVRQNQWDTTGWRTGYYQFGGDVIQLRKNMLEWNPYPQYEYARCENDKIILYPAEDKTGLPYYVQSRSGEIVLDENGDPVFEYALMYHKTEDGKFEITEDRLYVPVKDGELEYIALPDGSRVPKMVRPDTPKIKKLIYSGDKLELRSRMNHWRDVSFDMDGQLNDSEFANFGGFWFDYEAGRLFMRTRLFTARMNSLRITYRYGSTEPVPMAINRLCSLIVASQIVNMGVFNIKVGLGGDIANVKNMLLQGWEAEMGRIYSEYQRAGTVRSWSR